MNKIIEAALALILTIPEDQNDYPDLALYRRVQDKIILLKKLIKGYMMRTYICVFTDDLPSRKAIAFLLLSEAYEELFADYDDCFALYDAETIEAAEKSAKRDGWIPNDIWVFREKAFSTEEWWTEEVEISEEEAKMYPVASYKRDGKWYIECDQDGVVVG
tara:strand:+ start:1939 stop:2421 length:483 start_codon:yes stop_codon:yes gene_type:complete